jgi:hypothetical protein
LLKIDFLSPPIEPKCVVAHCLFVSNEALDSEKLSDRPWPPEHIQQAQATKDMRESRLPSSRIRNDQCVWIIVGLIGLTLLCHINLYLLALEEQANANTDQFPHSIDAVLGSAGRSSKTTGVETKESDRQLSPTHNAPFMQDLRDAGFDNAALLAAQLPSLEQISRHFGPKPILKGVETCEAFRRSVPESMRTLAVAGTFNTGTNLMAKLLEDNCLLRRRKGEGIEWQVNWGKHQSVSSVKCMFPRRWDLHRSLHVMT